MLPTQCVLKDCKNVCLPIDKPPVEIQTCLHNMQNANVQITSVKQIQFFGILDFVVVMYSKTCRECWYLLLAL